LRRVISGLCASLIAIAWLCFGSLLRAEEAPARVRVVTYNIHHGEGTDGRLDLGRIAAVIKGCGADLVALQEVDQGTERSGGVDQAAVLSELTGLHATFGKAMDYRGGAYGLAALSRWPLSGAKVHPLPAEDKVEPRIALVATVQVGDGSTQIDFIVTHLDHRAGSTLRPRQAAALREIFPNNDHQRLQLLAGDFNATPQTEAIVGLLTEWSDTAAGQGFSTIPAGKPNRKIDYVLARPVKRWRVIETRALEEATASDHRPVLAVLEVKDGE